MAQYAKYGQRQGAAVGARAVLWIVVSLVFLGFDLNRLARFRAVGLQPGWFLWAQIGLWTAALLFWSYSGVKALRKGKVS